MPRPSPAMQLRLWTREQTRLILVVVAAFLGVWPCVLAVACAVNLLSRVSGHAPS